MKVHGDICYVSSEEAANYIFSEMYTIAPCGFFSNCSESYRHIDPLTGISADVSYCELDNTRAGVLGIVCVCSLFALYLFARKSAKHGESYSR